MVLKILGIIIAVVIIGAIIFARSKGISPLSLKMHNAISQKNKIAIGGFDPVNFFEEGNAKMGNSSHTFEWKNVNWYFTSPAYLNKFKANPEQYEPQFGGWCAFAVGKGFTATPDPNAWLMHNGKLYLFSDEEVKKQWTEQLPKTLDVATKKWTY